MDVFAHAPRPFQVVKFTGWLWAAQPERMPYRLAANRRNTRHDLADTRCLLLLDEIVGLGRGCNLAVPGVHAYPWLVLRHSVKGAQPLRAELNKKPGRFTASRL